MGNENTKCSHHKDSKDAVKVAVDDALRKQRDFYERKCQELLNSRRHETIDTAIEALKNEKSIYLKKYEELVQKQHPQQSSNINQNTGPLKNVNESLQNNSAIYPSLPQNNNYAAQSMMQTPFMGGLSTSYSSTAPSAPPAFNNSPTAHFSNINQNTGPLKNVNESLQNNSAIYPSLPQNNNYAAQSMMQTPFMGGPSTSYSSTAPSAPPAFNNSPTAHFQPALIPPAVTNAEARKYGSGPSRENNNNQFYCQSCNNKFGKQVFRCQNKHNSCRNCRTRQVPCGVCGQPIVDFRNFALEKRLFGLKLEEPNNQIEKCPNSIDGCCLHFKPQDMKMHLKECPFNDIICPLVYTQQFKCSWNGKINQLRHHFEEDHPEQCVGDVDKEMRLYNINENYYMAFFVTLGAFNFMVHIKVEHSNIMMTAQLIGTKTSAEKWTYQFHVYNKRTPKRKYQYNAVCHSNAYLVQKIFSDENCAIINSIHAQSFANNGQITYKFYLIKGKKNFEVGNTTPNKSN